MSAFTPQPARGPFTRTWSGRCWHAQDPDPAAVDIGDIAHHLAGKERFGGALDQPYSVGQHSVLVSRLAERRSAARGDSHAVQRAVALTGLLHDAEEFALPDVPAPVKAMLTGWPIIERNNRAVIFAALGVTLTGWDVVHEIDQRIREDEVLAFGSAAMRERWQPELDSLGLALSCWTRDKAEWAFLERWRDLTGRAAG